MAMNKVLVTLLLSSLALVMVSAASNSKIFGTLDKNKDHIIKFEVVKEPSKVLQVVQAKKTFGGGRITQIRLLDQNKKGNGAKASIVNGGLGTNSVTVEFKSQRGHSIDYVVEIYGRSK